VYAHFLSFIFDDSIGHTFFRLFVDFSDKEKCGEGEKRLRRAEISFERVTNTGDERWLVQLGKPRSTNGFPIQG
jgi:hypothetical protein